MKNGTIIVKEGMNGTAIKSSARASAPPATDELASLRATVLALQKEAADQAAMINVVVRLFQSWMSGMPLEPDAMLKHLERWKDAETEVITREGHPPLTLAHIVAAMETVFSGIRLKVQLTAAAKQQAATSAPAR